MIPEIPATGPELAVLSTGRFCAKAARDVHVAGDLLEFNGGGACRFCPERNPALASSEVIGPITASAETPR